MAVEWKQGQPHATPPPPPPVDYIAYRERKRRNPEDPSLVWTLWTGEWPIPGWRIGLDNTYAEIEADYEGSAPERPIEQVAREMLRNGEL